MKTRISLPWSAIGEAASTVVGWTTMMIGACLSGFLLGYWIGHRQIMSWERTIQAFGFVPLLWLGSPAMIGAYLWAAVAWWLPLHYESSRHRIVSFVSTGLIWTIAIHSVVRATLHSKFFTF